MPRCRSLILLLPLALSACRSPAPSVTANSPASAFKVPSRPAVPSPSFKVFHQDNDTYTLVTKPDATDAEIEAILWQFRDAAQNHSFAALHLDQSFIDSRKPIVWFHVYRGTKCAGEKFTKGKLPCEAAYHGAGDFTLGDYKNPQWSDAVLHNTDGTETHLWDPDHPYNR